MSDGYWLVCVNRATGATTTHAYLYRDDAWKAAVDLEDPATYTTVVDRTVRGGKGA